MQIRNVNPFFGVLFRPQNCKKPANQSFQGKNNVGAFGLQIAELLINTQMTHFTHSLEL
jgi:hypothetical protein